MPRVNRRAVSGRLLLVWRMAQRIVEFAAVIRSSRGCSKIEFANGIADTITNIARAVSVARIRRRGHPDAHETHGDRGGDEPNSFGMTPASADATLRKRLPDAASRQSDGIISRPILDDIAGRIRLSPRDANAIDGLRLRHIEDDPLRMQGITFASETLGEIRVALPEGAEVAVCQSRKAGVVSAVVAGESATG